MVQHFRGANRDRAEITRDFPAFPEKSKTATKRELVQGSVIEGIENLRPMPPDNRVSVKMTCCISDYCNLNNRTLELWIGHDEFSKELVEDVQGQATITTSSNPDSH